MESNESSNDQVASPEVQHAPPVPAAQVPPPAKSAFGDNMDANQWALFLHLSQLAGYFLPGLGFAAPIVIWLVQKTPFPALDEHGKMVTNWMISLLIYSVASGIIAAATCGVGTVLFAPLLVVAVVFPILGAIKASEGVLWSYPLTIRFIK